MNITRIHDDSEKSWHGKLVKVITNYWSVHKTCFTQNYRFKTMYWPDGLTDMHQLAKNTQKYRKLSHCSGERGESSCQCPSLDLCHPELVSICFKRVIRSVFWQEVLSWHCCDSTSTLTTLILYVLFPVGPSDEFVLFLLVSLARLEPSWYDGKT